MPLAIEIIVEQSVIRFKTSLGWKAQFIDAEDIDQYRAEVRRVIQEARRP